MEKRAAFLIIFLLVPLLSSGCETARYWPLETEIYTEHCDLVNLDYYDEPGWWDYSTLTSIRKNVADYLEKNPNVDSDTALALKELTFKKGMDKQQVITVIGEPATKKSLENNKELWTYKGKSTGVLSWYFGWGKLTFKDGILTDIEVRQIKIYK